VLSTNEGCCFADRFVSPVFDNGGESCSIIVERRLALHVGSISQQKVLLVRRQLIPSRFA